MKFSMGTISVEAARTQTRTARRLLLSLLLIALAVCFVLPANAQTQGSVRHPRAQRQAQALATSDVQTFQTSLTSLVTWFQAKAITPTQQATVADLQSDLSILTPDEMTQLASSFDAPSFNTAVTNLMNVVARPRTVPPTDPPANLSNPDYQGCAPQSGGAPNDFLLTTVPSDPVTIFSLEAVNYVLQNAQIEADDLCSSLIVAAGEGSNLPACIVAIIADLLKAASDFTKQTLMFCDSNVSSAQTQSAWQNTIVIDTDIQTLSNNTTNQFSQTSNLLNTIAASIADHTTAIDADLANHISSIDSDLSNRISIVDSDVINKSTAIDTDINNHLNSVDTDILTRDTQIDGEISTLQTLSVRMEIEANLAGGRTIGLFELPAANGGYLETVRSIVNDTIGKLTAAGQTINGATKYLGLGDTAYSKQQYKAAYANYLTAYTTAVK